MKPSPTYFFFFLLLCGMPLLYGQDPSSVPPVQTVAESKVKVGELTRRIDSLSLTLQGFGTLGGLRVIETIRHPELVSGSVTPERLSGTGIPDGLSKIEIPSMKGLNLTERIDEQIRNWGGKAKGLGRSGRYDQYFGDASTSIWADATTSI